MEHNDVRATAKIQLGQLTKQLQAEQRKPRALRSATRIEWLQTQCQRIEQALSE